MERKIWQSVLGEIELTVPETTFKTVFKGLSLIGIHDNQVEIGFTGIFIKGFLTGQYKELITKTFEKNGIKNPEIIYKQVNKNTQTLKSVLEKKAEVYKRRESINLKSIKNQQNLNNISSASVTSQSSLSETLPSNLNPKYTFENFIVGSCNDLAYSAAQAVANDPGIKYNPLFLYSGVGLGKTHLMQAIGNEIIRKNPEARVVYMSIENFVQDFLDSIRFKKAGFSDKYRNVDVLIIDDIQFIHGKEKTQEEFFHTFNTLHQNNKQIIIASDRPPKSIPTLSERLRSRFEWGMTIDIQMPDFETRCAIIDAKASLSGIKLDMETTEFLANNFRTNIRELEGDLNYLLASVDMRGLELNVDTARNLLTNIKSTRPQHLTPKQIINKTAHFFQIDADEICSAKRSKHIVVPRQIAMYLLRSELHMSFPKISKELGRKDHTTAMHSIEKIDDDLKSNSILRENIANIRDSLYS
ncbi:MAG: chromosomal replication initiator protein DnaA [Candidatus Saccharibacteria bacterium]|nr:chromosomal replication initiator protein DnaA [Candidatus Saccharibacteria bacterium]